MKRRDIIHITVFIIIMSAVGFGLISLVNGFQDSQREYLCASLKINIITGSLDDIDRLEETKQLCNNENCIDYFEEKINNKITIINDSLEGKHCERFGLSEKDEVKG